jgi:hypothetical protein
VPQIQAASQNQSVVSPASGGTVTPDPSQNALYSITMPAGNITIANPLTGAVGQVMTFQFTQDSVGSRTVTWGAKFLTSQQPATTASSVSMMQFTFDGTNWQPLVPLSSQTYTVTAAVTTTAGSTTLAVLDGAYQVANVAVTFSTASTSGTLTVTVDTGTNAPGAGTAQLTGTVSLAGTANTVVNGTLIAAPTTTAAGNRIAFTTAGTLTNLVGCVVTVTLKRV